MEDLLHGVHELTPRSLQGELFPDRRLVSATARLFRPPAGSGECALVDAALYQARPQGSDSFLNPFISLNFLSSVA
jgi:hypothetical protein